MKPQLLLLCAATVMLTAQDAFAAKCYFRPDTNDFFSSVLTTRTAWDNNVPSYSAVQEEGTRWLEIVVSYAKQHEFLPTEDELGRAIRIPKGTTVDVTLADGTVIKLPAMDTVQAATEIRYPYEGGSDNYRRAVSATVRYSLSDASIDALSQQTASKVHINGENSSGEEDVWVDMNIPKRGLKQIQESVSCLKEGDSK
jgi:hypothetical protein